MRFERRKLDASIGAENLTKLRRRQLKKGVDAAFGKRRLTREPSHPTKTDADRRRGDGNDAGNKAGERKNSSFIKDRRRQAEKRRKESTPLSGSAVEPEKRRIQQADAVLAPK